MDNTQIVGEKIKSIRETKQISVSELAERTGLAEEQINRIENNVDIPSLAPLIKIARSLGVRLGTFLDDQDEVGAVVCRKEELNNSTISFSNNAMNARTHMQYHSLSNSKADRRTPFPRRSRQDRSGSARSDRMTRGASALRERRVLCGSCRG